MICWKLPSMERSFMSGSSTDDAYFQRIEQGLEEASQPGERQSCLYDNKYNNMKMCQQT